MLHILFALALLGPLLRQQPTASGSSSTGKQGRVVLEALDGTARTVSEDDLRVQPLERLDAVVVRFEGFQAPEAALDRSRLARVLTVEGDTIHALVTGGEGDLLHLEVAGGARLPVLVDRLQSLVFTERIPAGQLAGFGPAIAGDRLYWLLPAGIDRVDGSLEAFSQEGVRFQGRVLGARAFAWKEVAALYVEPLEEDSPKPGAETGQPLVVDLLDGSRLRGWLERIDATQLRLRVRGKASLDLPLGALGQVIVADGRVAFLSELEPAAALEGSPFGDELGMVWRHKRDLSVAGTPLQAGGRTWSRGLGVHAPSRITFALDGSWRELRGSVAVDDSVLSLSDRGSVRFRILVDGEQRWQSEVLRGGTGSTQLPRLELEGARELVLEADMATNLHVADRADWLGMMLVR